MGKKKENKKERTGEGGLDLRKEKRYQGRKKGILKTRRTVLE